jgi:hypothetical protein
MISRTIDLHAPYAESEVVAVLVGELYEWECLRKTGRGWKVEKQDGAEVGDVGDSVGCRREDR